MHDHDADKPAAKDEMLQELRWASQRPTSQARESDVDSLDVLDAQAWLAALNVGEEDNRSSYALLHPNQVWALNQNPSNGFDNASNDLHLQTLIANMHMLWTEHPSVHPAHWLMGSEALVAQCFPLCPDLWNVPRNEFPILSSFDLPREGRTSRAMMSQAGNSMNVIVMTAIHLLGLRNL